MFNQTKIKRKVEIDEFFELIDSAKNNIECTDHIFFRLNEKQRKIYTCDELKRILIKEKPFLIGMQYNENCALFYKYKNKNLKIIVNINNGKIKIVTFYFIEEWQIPKI